MQDKHSKNDIPVQREVGYVSHWSWRYLVVAEKRHKKLPQGLPRTPSGSIFSFL